MYPSAMSRIYNPPPTTTRVTSSNRGVVRGNSVVVPPSGSGGWMGRQSSMTTGSGVSDPLRLIKVEENPLSVKAKQTLSLLEQQNEWKKERRREAAQGVKESAPTDASWESVCEILLIYNCSYELSFTRMIK